jgi:hypothetical protein
MNSFPYCFFPTTVIGIGFNDDNHSVNECLNNQSVAFYKKFTHEQDALAYLNKMDKPTIFFRRLASHGIVPFDMSSVNYLYEEIYNPQRHETVSCLIYKQGELDDQSWAFLEAIENLPVKKILLTEGKNEKLEIQAFNKGLINFYICQQDPNLSVLLGELIQRSQQAYFQEQVNYCISLLMEGQLSNLDPDALSDPTFMNFIQEFIKQQQFTEFYLLDVSGSFLFLNDKGKASAMFVFNEERFIGHCQEVDQLLKQGYPFSASNSQALKERRQTICFPFINSHAAQKLEHYIAPIQVIEGRQLYYVIYTSKIDYLYK